MDNFKQHYEEYWTERKNEFGSYERDNVLPGLFKKGEKILDLGCGDGEIGKSLQERIGVRVSGLEISLKAAGRARKNGIDVKVGSVEEKFPFSDESFDAVFWGDNVEHLFNPMGTAEEIKRVLKKNGRLVVSCPNMGYWRYRIYYFLKGRLPDTEWTGNDPWGWSHIRFFNFFLLESFLIKAGFKTVGCHVAVSPRRIDKLLIKLSPSLFGMVQILDIEK